MKKATLCAMWQDMFSTSCVKITSSAHPIKGRLLLCLRDLLQEENEVVSCSAEWVE